MTEREAPARLSSAAQSISNAVMILRMEQPTLEAFLKECRDMENFGHIVHPTLYNKSERRVLSAVLEPLFEAASAFIAVYDDHIVKSKAALEKVST